MRYKKFKNANVDVSELGVGTWAIGGAGYGYVNDNDSIDGICTMLDNGVNLIDTAPCYGNGYAEQIVGKAIKNYQRDSLFISSKFGIGLTTLKAKKDETGDVRDSTFDNVLYECEQSLRRLDTDYIDFYFVHWPDHITSFEETARALNVLKKEGKIRFIGLSNFKKEQIKEFGKYCKVDAIQPPFSMLVRRDMEMMKWAQANGIDSLTYGSLGAGILSGKYRKVPSFGESDPRNNFYPYFKEPYFSKVMKLLEVMDSISDGNKRSLTEISLNWTTQKEYVSSSLCGVRNSYQALQDCKAFEWKLSKQENELIDEAIEKYLDFDGAAPME